LVEKPTGFLILCVSAEPQMKSKGVCLRHQ
jgi:hypothetical protein